MKHQRDDKREQQPTEEGNDIQHGPLERLGCTKERYERNGPESKHGAEFVCEKSHAASCEEAEVETQLRNGTCDSAHCCSLHDSAFNAHSAAESPNDSKLSHAARKHK